MKKAVQWILLLLLALIRWAFYFVLKHTWFIEPPPIPR